MILFRYLTHEISNYFYLVFLVSVVLIFGNYVCSYLSWAASGGLQASAVLKLLAFLLPNILLLLLPVSLFIALLLVLGKLFSTNELWAMFASGLSWRTLMLYLAAPAGILCIFSLLLSLYIVPASLSRLNTLIETATARSLTQLEPGQFYTLNDKQVAYIPLSDQEQHQPFLMIQIDTPNRVIYAQNSQMVQNKDHPALLLDNGWISEFSDTKADLNTLQFTKARARITTQFTPTVDDISAMPTTVLWKTQNTEAWIELRWRLMVGILPLVAVLFALTWCKRPPRKGRYYNSILSILTFIVFCTVLSILRSNLLNHTLPIWCGFELLIGFVICGSLFLLWRWDRRL